MRKGMRLHNQLLLGTSLLILPLVGVHWWLQDRQLGQLEENLTSTAKQLGLVVLKTASECKCCRVQATAVGENLDTLPSELEPEFELCKSGLDEPKFPAEAGVPEFPDEPGFKVEMSREGSDKMLVIRGVPGGPQRVPIPVSRTAEIIRSTMSTGLLLSSLLLLLGMLGAVLISRRISRPVRVLSQGVEAIRRGAFGTQIAVTASGELGELQTIFNRMSEERAALERERERWLAREHLAELGDVARGLGHTLRNPLNTVGLVVEQLARKAEPTDAELVATARAQIRRIDGWIRSFLALGAGRAAAQEEVDLGGMLRELELDITQARADLVPEVHLPEVPIRATLVRPSLRAALSNLVGNAIEASPPGARLVLSLEREGSRAILRIADRGPGLPAEVRERLFAPHVTTKPNGAGMGLFLARQLIESGLSGELAINDGPEGGTEAVVRLPLAPPDCEGCP